MSVGGFSVLDNHLHVLVRLDPERRLDWSDEEVVGRWGSYFRLATSRGSRWQCRRSGSQGGCKMRPGSRRRGERLQSLSWFMKCLKEPLARLANRQDQVACAFFEERFKSIAILDEESLLATCAYIDLNPVAAGIVTVPEESPHTSISRAWIHVKEQDRIEDLKAAEQGSVAGSNASAGWRSRSGSARSKIVGGLIRRGKGCWKGSRWAVTCSWSTTPAGYSDRARPRFQPRYPESSSGSGAARSNGGRVWKN